MNTIVDIQNIISFSMPDVSIQHAIFPFPLIPIALQIGIGGALGFLGKKLYDKVSKKTSHIVILGSKGSGKTILWYQLQGLPIPENPESTAQEPIQSFDIKTKYGTRTVSQTKDLGGGKLWVRSYEEIIAADGTFVYYLVDLLRLEETRLEVLSRIEKISIIIKEKGLKDCGLKILATNHKKYKESSTVSAVEYVKRVLDVKAIKDLRIKIDSCVLPIELTNPSEVQTIKDEITQN